MISYREGNRLFNLRVAGAAFDRQRVLVHRAVSDDFWAMPGGRIEMMEKAEDTLRREMIEEIGVQVQVHRLLWVAENFFEYNGSHCHELGLYFLMSLPPDCPLRDQPRFDGLEHGSQSDKPVRLIFEWQELRTLSSLNLYPSFVRQGLLALPAYAQHLVHYDT